MKNRSLMAIALAYTPQANKAVTYKEFRKLGLLDAPATDRSFRGSGNRAARRAGIFEEWGGCGCVVCVIYGGDCSNQMAREAHSEWHREQRGVKTRGR